MRDYALFNPIDSNPNCDWVGREFAGHVNYVTLDVITDRLKAHVGATVQDPVMVCISGQARHFAITSVWWACRRLQLA